MTAPVEQSLGMGASEPVFEFSQYHGVSGQSYSVDYSPVNTVVESVEGSTSGYDKRTQYVTIYYGDGLSKTLYFFSRYGSSSSSSSYSKTINLSDELTDEEIKSITKMTFKTATDADFGTYISCTISCKAYGRTIEWVDR